MLSKDRLVYFIVLYTINWQRQKRTGAKLNKNRTCLSCKILRRALQRDKTENLKQQFPEKELRGLSPNFHTHVSLSDLYIPYSAAGKYVDRSWEYIKHSQTHECGNWDRGRAIPFLGIHKCDFVAVCRSEVGCLLVPAEILQLSSSVRDAGGEEGEYLHSWGFLPVANLNKNEKSYSRISQKWSIREADKLHDATSFWDRDRTPSERTLEDLHWNRAALVPIPTIMFLWATYIFPQSVCLFLQENRWTDRGNI